MLRIKRTSAPTRLSGGATGSTPAPREARRRGRPTHRSPRSKTSSLTLSAPVRARTRDGAGGTLYTIGHSTRTTRELVDLLRAHGVEQVVDVRTIPKSRHNPQFNRPALTRSLHLTKIGYRHMKALGGLRHARLDSVNLGWRNASFRGYADYMQTEDFAAGLAGLEQLAAQRPTAIMCAEALPWRCHRSLIADALTVARWRVHHIQSRHAARPHKRTTFLRVRSGKLLYPAPTESSRLDTGPLRADPRAHRG
jgi:hypothetical protein